jgi:chromosome segregation ATPase
MSDRSHTHETVAWAKQRLDDLDAIISEVEKTSDKLKDSARKEVDAVLTRLKASRGTIQKIYDDLRDEANAVKGSVEGIQDALEAEWVEVESAFQTYLSAVGDRAESTRDVVVARAQAQRQSWEASLKALRDQAVDVVEAARGEFDAAIKRLSDETEKFQARIGEAKDAGDESWKAVKGGLADARAVHDRTIQKIKDAFSKLL